jgi:phosphoribosylanthranilate isomerase
MIPKIKICCIASIEEAHTAIEAGASAIGLVGKMPSGPGPIPDILIREIAASVPPHIATFLLTSETNVTQIIRHHERTRTNTIQLVDMLSEGSYALLRDLLPSIKIVQVIHILGEQSIKGAIKISHQVDALLLDSGNPNLAVKELGGTGRVHNWDVSRTIRESVSYPVFLAGGLKPDNVTAAIEQVRPFGVDVCSGIRINGRLDETKLRAFVRAVTDFKETRK